VLNAGVCQGVCALAMVGLVLATGSVSAQDWGEAPVAEQDPAPMGEEASASGRSLFAVPAPDAPPPLITLIETGLASWYHPSFAGRRMANGEPYRPAAFTAAHKTLPLDSHARVKNLSSGVEVVVRITDRGPHLPNRVIDVSQAAARLLGLVGLGITMVEVHSAEEEEWEAFVAQHPAPGLVVHTPSGKTASKRR
jgi:rare lipoprotein A